MGLRVPAFDRDLYLHFDLFVDSPSALNIDFDRVCVCC